MHQSVNRDWPVLKHKPSVQEEPDYWFTGIDHTQSYNLIKLATKSSIRKWLILYIYQQLMDFFFFFFTLSYLNANGWFSPGIRELKPSKQPWNLSSHEKIKSIFYLKKKKQVNDCYFRCFGRKRTWWLRKNENTNMQVLSVGFCHRLCNLPLASARKLWLNRSPLCTSETERTSTKESGN